jgi:ribose 5-phosphate isomerase B
VARRAGPRRRRPWSEGVRRGRRLPAVLSADDEGSLGIVIGGSGNGEQIAANKVDGIRAALAWSEETAQLARMHNNANVVSIGARMHSVQEAIRFVEVFLSTDFTGEARHARRIMLLRDYEETGQVPSSDA